MAGWWNTNNNKYDCWQIFCVKSIIGLYAPVAAGSFRTYIIDGLHRGLLLALETKALVVPAWHAVNYWWRVMHWSFSFTPRSTVTARTLWVAWAAERCIERFKRICYAKNRRPINVKCLEKTFRNTIELRITGNQCMRINNKIVAVTVKNVAYRPRSAKGRSGRESICSPLIFSVPHSIAISSLDQPSACRARQRYIARRSIEHGNLFIPTPKKMLSSKLRNLIALD